MSALPASREEAAMQTGRIAELNDLLRKTFIGGRIVITAGIAALLVH